MVSFSLNSLHCVSNNIVSAMQCNTAMSIIFIIPRFIMLKYEVFGTFMTGVFKTINSTGGSLLHTSPCTFISIKFHSSIISYFIISFIFSLFSLLSSSLFHLSFLLSSLLTAFILLLLFLFYYLPFVIFCFMFALKQQSTTV